jgi:ribosomal protein S12 methylthiotransferase accessory factor
MSRPPLTSWYASPFTGLFGQWGPIPLRPHDPAIPAWSGVLPSWGPHRTDLAVGGVGLDLAAAEAAALGEAIERWQARPFPTDEIIQASFARWALAETAVDPLRWVLFHPDQHALTGFPFAPLQRETVCPWVCCRVAGSGEPCWAQAWLIFLDAAGVYGPSLSTGLSAGRQGDPILLRGLQEVIERDALVGAWWGRYPLEEHNCRQVFALLPDDLPMRLRRPNLTYRCYRVRSPFSAHVSVVTLAGEDHEGFCFSAGSACRQTRQASWLKAILEAVQGRHYVRYLRRSPEVAGMVDGLPTDFAGHALYYCLHPERLRETVLERAVPAIPDKEEAHEPFAALVERLGPAHPVLFRLLTPPGISAAGEPWLVLRVLVPGLQPLHGHHRYPFLGGALWSPRSIGEHVSVLPHPFP